MGRKQILVRGNGVEKGQEAQQKRLRQTGKAANRIVGQKKTGGKKVKVQKGKREEREGKRGKDQLVFQDPLPWLSRVGWVFFLRLAVEGHCQKGGGPFRVK